MDKDAMDRQTRAITGSFIGRDFQLITFTSMLSNLVTVYIVSSGTDAVIPVSILIVGTLIFALIAGLIIFAVSGDGKFNTFTDPTMQFIVREWFTNPSYAWPYVLIMGIVASISFFCVFTAYSIASPSVVSLFEYSYLVWAVLAGYILFETIPVPRTFLGASIIIGAGVYIYFREKVRGQMIATDTPNR